RSDIPVGLMAERIAEGCPLCCRSVAEPERKEGGCPLRSLAQRLAKPEPVVIDDRAGPGVARDDDRVGCGLPRIWRILAEAADQRRGLAQERDRGQVDVRVVVDRLERFGRTADPTDLQAAIARLDPRE